MFAHDVSARCTDSFVGTCFPFLFLENSSMPVSVRGCSVSVVHILHSDVECHKPLLGWGNISKIVHGGRGRRGRELV